MTRTRRFLGGFASGYAHMAVATIAGLWLTPFFLERLGQSTFGLWLVGTQIIAYLLLIDFGVVALLPREAAYVTGRTGERDSPELRALIERTGTLALGQVPLVLAAAAAVVLLLPPSWAALQVPLGIALGVFVLTFPLRVFQAALTGMQDLAFVAGAQFVAWLVGTLLNIWLVGQGYGLPALAAGWCATQLLIAAACAGRLASRFPCAMPRRLRLDDGATVRQYLSRSGWVSVSQVAQALLNGSDLLVIGAVLGPAAVVPYACTAKLIGVLANQPQAILQSAAPALSELRTSPERARMRQVSAALSQATLALSGLIACVVLATNAAFVSWWVGPEQFGGAGLTALLAGSMVLRHFTASNAYTLFCFGGERRIALTTVADGLVVLGLTVVLVPVIGAAGAPLGAIAGVLFVSAPLHLRGISREAGLPPARLVAPLAPWLWCLALSAAAAAAAGVWLRPSSFVALAAVGLGAALVYGLAVARAVVRSPAGPYLQGALSNALRMMGRTRRPASPLGASGRVDAPAVTGGPL